MPLWFQSRNRESSDFNIPLQWRVQSSFGEFQSRNRESSDFNNYEDVEGNIVFGLFQSRNRESSDFNENPLPLERSAFLISFNLVIENLLILTDEQHVLN